MGRKNPKPKKLKGERMKNLPKTSRSDRHLCFSHCSNYQYFPHFFQYQYQNSQKIQYQNQYFGDANFNINIEINILNL